MTVLVLGAGLLVIITVDVHLRGYAYGLSLVSRPLDISATTLTGEITDGVTVTQAFRAERAGLGQIQILLSNYGQENASPMVLTVRSTDDPRVVRKSIAPPGSVADNRYHIFPFPPIADSAGKRFVASLQSPGAETGAAVTAWLTDDDPFPAGSSSVGGQQRLGLDLVMTLAYRTEIDGTLEELVNRLSQYKPSFFKSDRLIALVALSVVVTLLVTASVVTSILRSPDRARGRRSR